MANQMRPLRSSLFYSCCCEMHSKSAILEQAWHSMLMLSEVCPFASSARSSTSTAKCTLPNWCVILRTPILVVVICIHVNSTCKGTCLRRRNSLLHRPENHWIRETQWKRSSHLNPATKLIIHISSASSRKVSLLKILTMRLHHLKYAWPSYDIGTSLR